MSCHDARKSFPVLLAGKLRLTEWVEIETHVRLCDGCGHALEQFYRAMPKDDGGPLRLPVSTARLALRLAVCAVAVVLVAGIGGFAYQGRRDGQLAARQSALPSSTTEPETLSSDAAAVPAVVPPERPPVTLSPATETSVKTAAKNAVPKLSPTSGTDVVVQLSARDRGEAERSLGSLIARLGGSRLARDQRSTIRVAVPRSRYREFTSGLAQIGSWQMETRSRPLPDPVRVAVRLTR